MSIEILPQEHWNLLYLLLKTIKIHHYFILPSLSLMLIKFEDYYILQTKTKDYVHQCNNYITVYTSMVIITWLTKTLSQHTMYSLPHNFDHSTVNTIQSTQYKLQPTIPTQWHHPLPLSTQCTAQRNLSEQSIKNPSYRLTTQLVTSKLLTLNV